MTSLYAWLYLNTVLSGVPIKVLTTFNKLRALTKRSDVICSAMLKSRNGLVEVCASPVIMSFSVRILHNNCPAFSNRSPAVTTLFTCCARQVSHRRDSLRRLPSRPLPPNWDAWKYSIYQRAVVLVRVKTPPFIHVATCTVHVHVAVDRE